ncbi:MAG: hypothetical protein H7175_28395, partial [Burkholderiales bacterium]|nr:hypothetical protein [Anaerolineae bacterium]
MAANLSVSNTALTRRRSRLTLNQRRYMIAAGLLAPAVLLRLFTTIYPFLQTLYLSTQRANPAFPPQRFIGFGNFERLAGDIVVQSSIEFTLIFVFVSTFFQIVLGIAVAHLLNAPFRLRGLARTISLIPWAIPMVVAAIGFRWMFDDQFGMIPDLLRRIFGLDTTWLINPQNARLAVVLVNIWKSTPFVALLLWVEFDFNPYHLRDPQGEAMATLADLMRDPDRTPNT